MKTFQKKIQKWEQNYNQANLTLTFNIVFGKRIWGRDQQAFKYYLTSSSYIFSSLI